MERPLDRRPLRFAVPQGQEPAQGVRGGAAPVRRGRVGRPVQRRPDVRVHRRRCAAERRHQREQVDGGLDDLQVDLDLVPRRRGDERLAPLEPHQLVHVPAEHARQPGVGLLRDDVRAQHRGQAAVAVGRAVLQLLEPRDDVQVGEPVVRPRTPSVRQRLRVRPVDPAEVVARVAHVLLAADEVGRALEDERGVDPLLEGGREVPPVVLDRAGVAVVRTVGRRCRVAQELVALEREQVPLAGDERRVHAVVVGVVEEPVAHRAPRPGDRPGDRHALRGVHEAAPAEEVHAVARAGGRRVDPVVELLGQRVDADLVGQPRGDAARVALVDERVLGAGVAHVLVAGEQERLVTADEGRVHPAGVGHVVADAAEPGQVVGGLQRLRHDVQEPVDEQVDGAAVGDDRVDHGLLACGHAVGQHLLEGLGQVGEALLVAQVVDDGLRVAGIDVPVARAGVADVLVAGEQVGRLPAPDERRVDGLLAARGRDGVPDVPPPGRDRLGHREHPVRGAGELVAGEEVRRAVGTGEGGPQRCGRGAQRHARPQPRERTRVGPGAGGRVVLDVLRGAEEQRVLPVEQHRDRERLRAAVLRRDAPEVGARHLRVARIGLRVVGPGVHDEAAVAAGVRRLEEVGDAVVDVRQADGGEAAPVLGDRPGMPVDLDTDVGRPGVGDELVAAEHVGLPVAAHERGADALALRDGVARAPPVLGRRELPPQRDVVAGPALEQVGVAVRAVQHRVETGAEVLRDGPQDPRPHGALLDDLGLERREPVPARPRPRRSPHRLRGRRSRRGAAGGARSCGRGLRTPRGRARR